MLEPDTRHVVQLTVEDIGITDKVFSDLYGKQVAPRVRFLSKHLEEAGEIHAEGDNVNVVNEIQQNFIDSSFDINNNRAFPNVKDGLKPGQRACLWEMYTKKYTSNKPHVKSAKIDGGVAALWWPHGTTALYETFARMSQPFTNNVPEVDFHGANGNVILGGDAVAADRYTEARLAKITEEGMFQGLNKHNVDMILNFSEDASWPKYLPAVFPRLLVNGAQGIGVSLANVWLPHNFKETSDLILQYIKTGELDEDHYYPDFPTGGIIINQDELPIINKTGKGRVIIEAKYSVHNNEINFYEMPYQVFIEPVIEKIKEKIENEELSGIIGVYNKSDKKNISLVVECDRGVDPENVVAQLFELTPLRSQFNANQNGIISKTPILLNLKEVIDTYIEHNVECIVREFKYDYKQAKDRIEILEGLLLATNNIDKIINIIRTEDDPKVAIKKAYAELTDRQIQAILDMKLSRLSKLESDKLKKELNEKQEFAEYCKSIFDSEQKQKEILCDRLDNLVKKYGEPRKSELKNKILPKKNGKKVVAKKVEDVVITFNPIGYLQNIPVTAYKKNRYQAFKITTEDLILLFSNKGRFFRVAPKDIKSCGIKDKGTAIGAIVKLQKDEKIISVFSSIVDPKRPYILFAMQNGQIKKTKKEEYISSTRNLSGMVATKLKNSDVVTIEETNGNDILLTTKNHYQIRFNAEEVRASGKASLGVKGILLQEEDYITSCEILQVTDRSDIARQKRAGKGHLISK